MSKQQQKLVTHAGDELGLQDYINEHRAELEQQAQEMRQHAKELVAGNCTMPYSNTQWLEWLSKNQEYFDHCVKTATRDRRGVAARVLPMNSDMPAVSRLQPKRNSTVAPDLVAKLASAGPGFYHLTAPSAADDGCHCVVFACCLRGIAWGCLLQREEQHSFTLDVSVPFCRVFNLLDAVVKDVGVDVSIAGVTAHALDMRADFVNANIVQWSVQGAIVVSAPARRAREGPPAREEEEADDSEGAEGFTDDEAVSLDSSGESGVDDTLEDECEKEAASETDSDVDVVDKAPKGSHVVWSNGYFTLIDDHNYPDAKIRIMPRFCVDGELGRKNMSKTLVIGDDIGCKPDLTYLLLRAWMLWRSNRDGWIDRKNRAKSGTITS